MWSDRCRWSRWVKMLVSAAVALALVAILLPQTTPPETPKSGITIVGMAEDKETYGPEVPENRLQVEVYSPRYTALIIKADPTPVPRFVYCNQGGKYYHRSTCRYVKEISGAVTRRMVVSHFAPDTWLHSSSDTWIWLMADTTVRMPIIRYLMR